MTSRPLVIAGIVGGILAGIALCAGVLTLVAVDGDALSAQVTAMLMLGVAMGVVLDATWLTFARAHLDRPDPGSAGDDGQGEQPPGGRGPDPAHPSPQYDGPSWWPEFERDFRAHLESTGGPPARKR
jgi:hypothetical protein